MLRSSQLAAALTCVLGKVVAQPEVDKLMKKFDTSGDGQLDKDEFEKFAADMAKKKKGGFSMKSAATKKKEAEEVEAKREELKAKAEGGGGDDEGGGGEGDNGGGEGGGGGGGGRGGGGEKLK